MNEYTNEQILEGLTTDEINMALKVISHINYKSAYGHNPKCCSASATIKHLLDKNSGDWCRFDENITSEQRQEAILNYCRHSRDQYNELMSNIKDKI